MDTKALDLYLYMGNSKRVIEMLEEEGIQTEEQARAVLRGPAVSNLHAVASSVGGSRRGDMVGSLHGTARASEAVLKYFREKEGAMKNEGVNWTRTGAETVFGVELERYTWKRHAPINFRKPARAVAVAANQNGVNDYIYEGGWGNLVSVPVWQPKDENNTFEEFVAGVVKDDPKIVWAAEIAVENMPGWYAWVACNEKCEPVDDYYVHIEERYRDR